MNKILYFILIFISSIASAQPSDEKNDFAKLLYQIMITANSNPQKAMHQADSLYLHSPTKKQQVRALMLSANILEKQDRQIEGIEYALKALEICKETKDYSFEARIYGFLSTQSRNVGFYDEGKHYLQKGIAVSSKIDNPQQIERYLAMANHELAEYAYEEKDYKTALEKIELALLAYNKEKDEKQRYFIVGDALGFKGRCFNALNENKKAINAFKEGDSLINKSGAGNTIHAALIYQGIGHIYIAENNMESAIAYLRKAQQISEKSKNNRLKGQVYKSLASYYRENNSADSFTYYINKHQHVLMSNQQTNKMMVNDMYPYLQKNRSSKKEYWPMLGGSLLMLVLGASFILIKRSTKQKKSKVVSSSLNGTNSSRVKISKQTKMRLDGKIKDFEASRKFLNKDFSFPEFTSLLKTNAKYLNHYLKTHQGKDYTTYINDLRIHYIIDRLQTDKTYLQYKISYLADEAGFSSHSTFSSNFKRVTQFSPSEFINNLIANKT